MGYRIQAGSINASRAVYALNWFNIAPGLKYISTDLGLQIVQLGIITTGFYIGLAAFQMVGGLLASRIGNKNTSVLGITLLGISVIATGLSNNLIELFTFRLTAGTGAALFFSPALGLVADIVPKEKYSFYVGLFNGSFNLGGGLGIFGWNLLDQFFSWRIPLYIAGVIMLLLAVENLIVLRGYKPDPTNRLHIFRRARGVLKKPEIWILSIIALSGVLTETIVGQLFVFYAEVHLNFTENLASSLGTIFLIVGFFGGTLGGYFFGRAKRRITMFMASVIVMASLTIVLAFSTSFYVILALVVLLGILTVNSLSMLYTLVVERAQDRGMISFSLSFVNFLQNAVGAISPTLFSVLAYYRGYVDSWAAIGIIGLCCAVLGFTLKSELANELIPSEIKI